MFRDIISNDDVYLMLLLKRGLPNAGAGNQMYHSWGLRPG